MSDDLWNRLRDMDAVEAEQSNVSGDSLRQIRKVAHATVDAAREAGVGGAPSAVIAKLIVEECDPAVTREIVTDWLEGRGWIGSL